MNKILLSLLCLSWVFTSLWAMGNTDAGGLLHEDPFGHVMDMVATDTLPPIEEREGDFITDPSNNPFDLNDPSVIQQEVEYDSKSGLYIITEKIGDEYYRAPTYMTFEEYLQWSEQKQRREHFEKILRNSRGGSGNSGLKDPMEEVEIPNELLANLKDKFKIDIKPQGNVDLILGADFQTVENPIIPERQRRQGGFDFDMNIQMGMTGSIGDLMDVNVGYNTQSTFNFENQMKLEYTGKEDDIIKKIEAGNVSFPLRSQLIQGNQSLFGIKSELQFGRMTLTGVVSQQRSRRKQLQIQGGSQVQNFEVNVDNYDENRHFFLSHYNRGTFENSLKNIPQVNSLFQINRMEVWVTNTRNQTEGVRDIVALGDIAEGNPDRISNTNPAFQPNGTGPLDIFANLLPTNAANPMFDIITGNPNARTIDGAVSALQNTYNLQQARDFEKVSARMLAPNEYTAHPELGFVSLNVTLQPEDVLGVAVEFTYNGQVYKIGEFTNDVPINPDTLNVLYVKMLKSTTPRVDIPMWDLMMKNIYSLGAYQVGQEDFLLDIYYEDPGGGEKRFLPATALAGTPLLQVFNLDNLNGTLDPQPDGRFDFVEGLTIQSRNGRIMFPKLEPFGSDLYEAILEAAGTVTPAVEAEAAQYAYDQLYDSTVIVAREYPEFNRFTVRGTYRSSFSSQISLGAFNVPRGSVTVRAGGQTLVEGRDYTVDYNIGQVTILNDSYMSSGIPINVSFEDNAQFGFQQKTLLGLRADYKISDDFNIGGTVMKLYERPFTQKVNIGDDPINNTIYGLDVDYTTNAPWLTKAVDAIPGINTKVPSQVSLSAEAAYLKPGNARAINQDGQGVVYVDDFEGSTSSLDLRIPAINWTLASIPQGDQLGNAGLFPEAQLVDTVLSGVNRAKLLWYQIDQTSVGGGSNPYTESVFRQDIFPNTPQLPNLTNIIRTLDLTYYPNRRGPYNFDLPAGGTEYSAGLGVSGELLDPETRWAGIQRELTTNNFEAANVEYVEFWMLSPFMNGADGEPTQVSDGDMYLNLGNVSEDVLRDSRLFFENGLPGEDNADQVQTDQTSWSRVPRARQVTRAFDNNPANRELQDVGLDGANDSLEQSLYQDYVNTIQAATMPQDVKDAILADPANDNFRYYNDGSFTDEDDIFDRYYNFNNPEGNSRQAGNQVNSATNIPDTEDINRDNTLNETEAYFQYKIPIERLSPTSEQMKLNEYVVESVETSRGRHWYRIKVPVTEYTSRIGGIQDFRSIRFIRLFLTRFDTPVTLRFARFELVRNQWRRYRRSLAEAGVGTVIDEDDGTIFDVNDVNFEENGAKEPYNYVLPPGIVRENQIGSAFANALQNEQSLAIDICNLRDGEARAIFKNINLDIRLFKRMQMFVHAEESNGDQIEPGEMTMFVRIGSDFEKNYYEYEFPLIMTEGDLAGLGETEYADSVWLPANRMDLNLALLQQAKTERNNSNVALSALYTIPDPEYPGKTIGVKGNPNLGLVKNIMVGLRNTQDDGLPRCAEVWINELRMSGFDERGGWGATARMDMQMADFGNVNLATNYTSIGFGSIEQKLIERSREEVIQLDAAANLELGKFLPEKAGIKIPVYGQYSTTIRNPQYDPYDLDVELKDKVAAAPREDRDSIRSLAQDRTTIKSFNATNVRKERTNPSKKPKPWDIENLSLTYAYTDTERSTPLIESDQLQDHQGIVDYSYSRKVTYLEPFKKVVKKPGVAKYLKFLTDINLNPLPNSFGFSTRMHRQFQTTDYRFSEGADNRFYDKKFTWDRSYNLKWDLTRSLKVDFNAINNTVIDEPNGGINQIARDSIMTNIRNWGRNKDYQHNFNVTYDVPLKNFPFLDFMKVRAQYNANFGWQAAALNLIGDDGYNLGNIIRNGNTRQINGDLDFVKLYNNSKYLKKINSKAKPKAKTSNRAKDLRKDKDKKDDAKPNDKDDKKKDGEPSAVARALLRPLMMVRQARFTYSKQNSSLVPGFLPEHNILGMNGGFSAPGWDYVLGWRMPDEAWLLRNQEWITQSVFLNQQVLGAETENISAKLTVEPFEDFRIELEADKQESRNNTSFFKKVDSTADFEQLAFREMGTFQVSYFTLGTTFNNDYNGLFNQFEDNRRIISRRLAEEAGATGFHSLDTGYYEGYGRYQLDVMIPAFLSAYNGQSAEKVRLNVFKTVPLPNWRLTYKGLHKLPGMDKIFSSVNITHSYRSSLAINSFNTETDQDADDRFATNPNTDNYFSSFEIPNIVIAEQLSPLIGVDMRFKNDLTARLDWKKSRNLQMGFTDYQLSESRSEEFVVGLGYRLKNVYIKFLDIPDLNTATMGGKDSKKNGGKTPAGGTSKDKKGNDMNFKLDVSWRNDVTVNHLLDQGTSVPTRGLKTIRISPNIDYQLNKQLTLRLFYDYSRTIPATSASFPITNTSAGLNVRFTFN